MTRRTCSLIVLVAWSAAPAGEVSTDGSLGPRVTLPGPQRVVPASLGQQRGGNLFHSFQKLDIDRGESVRFTGPSVVRNVLARVTGGSASRINGLLASDIDGANLFLINPAGIVFGEKARLEVSGAFVATTADDVKLADGGKFAARTPGDSVLTAAPPTAFGFLGPSAGGIQLRGVKDSPAKLTVAETKGVSLVAGDIQMDRGQLRAPGGWVTLATVAGAGEVMLSTGNPGMVQSVATPPAGQLRADRSLIDASGVGVGLSGGTISLRTGTLILRNTFIDSSTVFGPDPGAPLSIEATRQMKLEGGRVRTGSGLAGDAGDVTVRTGLLELLDGGVLGSLTFGLGNTGDVDVTADRIVLAGANEQFGSTLGTSASFGTGNAGNVTLRCDSLLVADDARVRADTLSQGAGGRIDVRADRIVLAGDGAGETGGIVGSSLGDGPTAGNGGTVSIVAKSLRIERDASVIVGSNGGGDAGVVDITADEVVLNSADAPSPASITAISISSTSFGGDSGTVKIKAGTFRMLNASLVTALTVTEGNGGNVSIEADRVRVDQSLILAGTGGLAPAGSVSITAGSLRLGELGIISTATDGDADAGRVMINAGSVSLHAGAMITAETRGGGRGGDVSITADAVHVARGMLLASSLGSGDAGNVSVDAGLIRISDAGRVAVESAGTGAAGDIALTGRRIFIDSSGVAPGAAVSTVSAISGGPSAAGNIRMRSGRIEVTNGSVVNAGATGAGPGGNIYMRARDVVVAGTLSEDDVTLVAATTAGSGPGGLVDVRADRLRVGGGAALSAATAGAGPGGRLAINADQIDVDGGAAGKTSAILVGSIQQGTGDGGEADIRAADLRVRRGGTIVAGSETSGDGGDLRVRATRSIQLSGGSISVASDPTENDFAGDDSGDAGSVFISAPLIRAQNKSDISAISARTNGGTVSLSGNIIDLLDSTVRVQADQRGGSVVFTAAERFYALRSQVNAVGNQSIGSISIDPIFTVLNQSSLLTDTRPGGGGNINITTEQFLRSDSTITAAGIVQITVLNADTDVTAGLLQLRGDFLDEAARLREACGQRVEGFSSFVVEGRGGVPAAPGTPLPPPDLSIENPTKERR